MDILKVSKSHPCPICKKTDWCGYSKDGKFSICMRTENEHPSKNGGWIHLLEHSNSVSQQTSSLIDTISYQAHSKAENKTLHKVYNKLLDLLPLSSEHSEHLKEERGLSEEQIKRQGYRTLPDKHRYKYALTLVDMFGIQLMSTVPGFMVSENETNNYPTFAGNSGLLIPIKDVKRQIAGFQVRIDNPENPKDRYRWFSSSERLNGTGSGSPAHIAYPLEIKNQAVWITEGALKANIAADKLGNIVIGIPGVANWRASDVIEILKELSPSMIIISYDADSSINPIVKTHQENLALACKEAGYKVQIATWPIDLGKGIDDLLVKGHKPEIKEWVEETQKISIEDSLDSDIEIISDIKWPVLPQEALYGLAGDVVRTIEPHTESDPKAILMQFLGSFGNRVGRNPYFLVERTRHYLNLFILIVGATAKARKGTSLDWIKYLMKLADFDFGTPVGGLVSGEGLIFHVRDAIHEITQDSKTGDYKDICKDEGVKDKRLLVCESEFSAVLKVLKREGNTLSETIRQAWDSGDLNTLAKNSKTKATNAHISLIGHITTQELRKELDEVSYANGFGNRILWCLVKRSKYLPMGSQVPETEINELKVRLQKTIEFSKNIKDMRRDNIAEKAWEELYRELSEGKPGLSGVMASRAEAQVLRLSCIYALLDLSSIIRIEHLMAAISVWKYCFESCRYIFGDALGDPLADQIRESIRESTNGLTRSEIYNMFRRYTLKQIEKSLTVLIENSLVKREIRKTKGRPVEVWVSNEEMLKVY